MSALARLYALNPSAQTRTALLEFARTHSGAEGGLALLAVGAQEARYGRAIDAVPIVRSAQARLPKLADYTAYLLSHASYGAGDFESAASAAESVASFSPPSPMSGASAAIGARAYLRSGAAARAITILKRSYDDLAQPQGDALLASAYEAAGDLINAVAHHQRVWLNFPASAEAKESEAALARLRLQLGPRYAAPRPEALLDRAGKLLDAREFIRARAAFEQLSGPAPGLVSELAAVRVGVADYRSRKEAIALGYLQALRVKEPEANAERLYYVGAVARRLNKTEAADAAVAELDRSAPKSEWRLRALVAAGDDAAIDRPQFAETMFRACYTDFGDAPQAPYCHWKAIFQAYLENRSGWTELFVQHAARYPESDKASAALYFLGRAAERGSRWADARAYYDQVDRRYPNYYYAVLARSRRADQISVRNRHRA